MQGEAGGTAVGCGSGINASQRDIAHRADTHVTTVGLQRGAVGHGDRTGAGLQVDRHGCATGGDIGVLQDGAARHQAGVAYRVEQVAAQGDVAGSAAGTEQDMVCGVDVARAVQGGDATSGGGHDQAAGADHVVLRCIGLLGSACIRIHHSAVGQHAFDRQRSRLAHGDGGGLAQVQPAAADIGAEGGHFEFEVVVRRTDGAGTGGSGAKFQLFGVDIDGRIGVINNAATSAGDADQTPWGGDIGLFGQGVASAISGHPSVEQAGSDGAAAMQADVAAVGLDHGVGIHGDGAARIRDLQVDATAGGTDIARCGEDLVATADQADVAAAAVQAVVERQRSGGHLKQQIATAHGADAVDGQDVACGAKQHDVGIVGAGQTALRSVVDQGQAGICGVNCRAARRDTKQCGANGRSTSPGGDRDDLAGAVTIGNVVNGSVLIDFPDQFGHTRFERAETRACSHPDSEVRPVNSHGQIREADTRHNHRREINRAIQIHIQHAGLAVHVHVHRVQRQAIGFGDVDAVGADSASARRIGRKGGHRGLKVVAPQAHAHCSIQQQAVGNDVDFGVVARADGITVKEAAAAGDDAHTARRTGIHFFKCDVASGGLQADIACGGAGHHCLCARLRHIDGVASGDVDGFAVGTGRQVGVLQQVMTGVHGDVASADGVGVQGDVAGSTASIQQQVAGGRDACCGGCSSIDRDTTDGGHQNQVTVGTYGGQVLLGIGDGGCVCASSVNAVHRQTQVGHGDSVTLGEVSATRLTPAAELCHRGFDAVHALANGGAGQQDQVGGCDVHRSVAQDVEHAASSSQNGDLACSLAAGRDFTQGDVAGAGCVADIAAGALAQSTIRHGDGVVGQQVDGHDAEACKDVGISRLLQDAVFGGQRDVAAGAADAGVEGEVGISGGIGAGFTRAEQDIACGADASCRAGRTAAHRDGAVGSYQNQVATRAGGQGGDQVFLLIGRGRGRGTCGTHALHGQTQVGDRDRIGLGDKSAAVG